MPPLVLEVKRRPLTGGSEEKDPSIKMEDVKQFFAKHAEEKRKRRGQNSFDAPHIFLGISTGLIFHPTKGFRKPKENRIGLVLIDIVSKPPDVLGFNGRTTKREERPKLLYSDEERTLNSNDIMSCLEKKILQSIKLEITHFLRTIFTDIQRYGFHAGRARPEKRQGRHTLDGLQLVKCTFCYWSYSSRGKKPKNEINAKLNMTIKATKTGKHPELEEGSQVKVMRKKRVSEKERTSHWLKEIKTIRKIETKLGQKYPFLDGDTVGYLRQEFT